MVTSASAPADPSVWALLFAIVWVGGVAIVYARGALNHRGIVDRSVSSFARRPHWVPLGQTPEEFRRNQQRVSVVGLGLIILIELMLVWLLIGRIVS